MEQMLTQTKTQLCLRSMELMGTGEMPDFVEVIHPEATNREAVAEPPATRGRGPAAFYATALWLRAAFADLHWEIHDVITQGDLIAVHGTMSGRHTGPFVSYDADGKVAEVFPATGRTFAITQSHWFRVADGMVIEHWANRDDLGMAQQSGWVPPSPLYLLRMALAKRRARRQA